LVHPKKRYITVMTFYGAPVFYVKNGPYVER
jgi:hypothetical protein